VVHLAPSRRLHRRQVEDGRVDATDYVGPCYHIFIIFNVIDPRGIVVIYLLLGPIYRTLEWMGLLTTSQFHFAFLRLGVNHDLVFFCSNQMREGGDLRGFGVIMFDLMENQFVHFTCAVRLGSDLN
jgi:hypothetical protein